MTNRPTGSRRDRPSWLSAIAVVLALVGLFFIWIWFRDSEGRAVRSMPAAERAALFQRTLEDVRTACGPGRAEDLLDHCEHQARFLLKFPECDAACARLAGDVLDPR